MSQDSEDTSVGMQSSDYILENDMLVWWSTPILRRTCSNHEQVNADLKEIIYARVNSDQGMKKSNQGGWHSNEDLLEWGGPAIAQLQYWIIEAFNDLTARVSGGKAYNGKLELNAWANINRAGDYNVVHTHPACVWSGVYYVDAGTPATNERQRAGALEFLDPRAGAEMLVVPGAMFGQTKIERPETGQLIAFPSWLRHLVHPYEGEGDRISIAFNIRVRPNL